MPRHERKTSLYDLRLALRDGEETIVKMRSERDKLMQLPSSEEITARLYILSKFISKQELFITSWRKAIEEQEDAARSKAGKFLSSRISKASEKRRRKAAKRKGVLSEG